jgi:hypothetical protein
MTTKHAVQLTVCVAIIAFAIAFALPAFVDVPMLWYRPVDRVWSFDHPDGTIAMDFFGRCLFATLATGVVSGLTYAAARRRRREPSPWTVSVLAVWAVSISIIALTFFAWRFAHRTVSVAPAQSCAQPR